MTPVLLEWEAKLDAAGLGVVGDKTALSSKFRSMTAVEIHAFTRAVEEWQAWAQRVLREHKWPNDHQRRAWQLYAEGVSTRKIPRLIAGTAARRMRSSDTKRWCSEGRPGSRRCVQRIFAAVIAAHPGPPNPWTRRAVAPARRPVEAVTPPARRFTAEERAALARQLQRKGTT